MNGRLAGSARGARGREMDYLGYCFTGERVRLRKSIKRRFARKMSKRPQEKKRQKVLASYHGWCKWADCRRLWNKLTDGDMSFATKGIRQSGLTRDGKKFFDARTQRISDILNVEITVLDFETGIRTKQGDGRYCVLFEADGRKGKFITNCYTLKDVLDEARKAEESGKKIFPVDGVVIRRREIGDGKSTYVFGDKNN